MRRPGGVAEAGGFVAGGEVEEGVEGAGVVVHVSVGVAEGGEAGGHGEDSEVCGVAGEDFVPLEGGTDAGVGERADGVGGGGGAVLGVLVVVKEDAVALLFPPFAGGEGGGAAFYFAGEGESSAANFGKGPAGVDAAVDVDAAGAGGFDEGGEAVFFENGFGDHGDVADVLPNDAGAGVEIDTELVRVVEVGGEDWVGVELHAAEVDDVEEAGGVVDDDLFGGAAGGEAEGDGAEVGGQVGWGALLVEGLGLAGGRGRRRRRSA